MSAMVFRTVIGLSLSAPEPISDLPMTSKRNFNRFEAGWNRPAKISVAKGENAGRIG
jgi:hypothetical protein